MHPFFRWSALLLFLLTVGATWAPAQVVIRSARGDSLTVKRFDADNVMLLPEVGGVIMAEGGDLRVARVQPPHARPPAFRQIDIREGDLVLLFNGMRVRTLQALRTAYQSVPPKEQVRLGIQRDRQLMSVSFPKADMKDLPQLRIIERKK
jgi:S1-C subfamily serine protease